jgi:hypothetical protein
MNIRIAPMMMLLLSGFSMPAVGSTNDPLNTSLIDARQAFVAAEKQEDWATLRSYVWDVGAQSSKVRGETLADGHIRQLQMYHKAGVVVLTESIISIKIYREEGRQLALFEVDRLYEHPMDPRKPVSARETHYAFLEKGQERWQFNVLGCFSESDIKKFFPSYPSNDSKL